MTVKMHCWLPQESRRKEHTGRAVHFIRAGLRALWWALDYLQKLAVSNQASASSMLVDFISVRAFHLDKQIQCLELSLSDLCTVQSV